MKIFNFKNYRTYLNELIVSMPKRGHGQLIKFAKAMSVHPSVVTLVLKGKLDLTLEQATDLADCLALNNLESDYFINLVALERAGTEKLRSYYKKQLNELKHQSENLKKILPDNYEMSEEAMALFYSQWYYSAIRILTSISEFSTPRELSQRTGISIKKVQQVLEFLVKNNLCIEKDGLYAMGPLNTHIDKNSLLVGRHHANWRQKAIEALDRTQDNEELFFTSTVSLSKADLQKVKDIFMKSIEKSFDIISPSPSEEAFCLIVDWFKI